MMAYSSTVTVNEMIVGSYAGWCVLITETDAEATSEVEIDLAALGLPQFGRIITQVCHLTSGAGSTVDPVLGNVTNPSTATWQIQNDAAAARVQNVPATGIPYCSLITSMFHRSNVDSGTNNSITSAYYFIKGWPV